MPPLDWEQFEELPGAPSANWEKLCGAVVRRSFGAFGRLRYVAQQPGVEFHLAVEQASTSLGDPGRWWGWQCRWYDLPSGRQLGKGRRGKIEEAIRKTEQHVPGITDWVLWTRRPLTPTDQDWFCRIESRMRLRLWTADDLDAHLVGEAEVLRRTYFGDLILTPQSLHDVRERSIAPIRKQWMPNVHIEVGAESKLRKILGEPRYWPEVEEHVTGLAASIEELGEMAPKVDVNFREDVESLAGDLKALRATFEDVGQALGEGELATATELVTSEWSLRVTRTRGLRLARGLRKRRAPSSFAVQAGLAWQRDSENLFSRLRQYLSIRAVAVIGPAGCGKTHLGAQLTAVSGTRPSGLYIAAWPLKRRDTVNQLLDRIEEIEAKSFVQLLEAVEAAGARAGTRIPVVIDGLNESEDPANWREELARLEPVLNRLSHVLIVVTLRPPVAELALPDGFLKLALPGFEGVTGRAMRAYFKEYKIDPGSVRLPFGQFRDPLFLRIFCEATNPDRAAEVKPDEVPASLVAAFDRFRSSVVERIAKQPGGMRRYEPDILRPLDAIALSLWRTKRRAMPFGEIRELIGDKSEDWTKSLARTLRDEGILGTEPYAQDKDRTVILFDAFAGFLIADALIRERGRGDFAAWIASEEAAVLLGTDPQEAHPLASDIRSAFVGLAPRRLRMQFWQLVEGELRREATLGAAGLEGSLLDEATVQEIALVALKPPHGRVPNQVPPVDLFDRFHEVRDAVGHPLNAAFLDELLGTLPVADRDLRWTEWIRSREDENLSDIDALAEDWQSRTSRTHEDHLRAIWVKWLLTSTLRDLRDLATRALYWYGRVEPAALFRLALSGLQTNDAYVPERLLAASFGVMMAAPGERREFGRELRSFLDKLWDTFCSEEAVYPSDHWLVRHYVEGIVGVVRRYYPTQLSQWSSSRRFAQPARPEPISRDDSRNSERELVHGMDFRNYTVGRLLPDRANYDFDDPEYEEVSSWIRARVWDLGWRLERFRSVEEGMYEQRRRRHNRGRLESYLKKYGWIGFFEAAGKLMDEGRPPLRDGETHLSDVDIDPSFPVAPPTPALTIPGFLSEDFGDLESWVTDGVVDVSDVLLRTETIGPIEGPWVALSAYLEQEDLESKRKVFGILWCLLVRRGAGQELRTAFHSQKRPGRFFWRLHPLEDYYAFAGEMPWSLCTRFGASSDELPELYAGSVTGADGHEIPVELVSHYYSWESYHSVTNQAGGLPVPAVTLAEAFDLRVVPASLDWCDRQGRRASLTLAPPEGFKDRGHLLYFREDLIREYCDKHDYELIWVVWGERDPWFADPPTQPPAWLRQVYEDGSEVWRRVVSLDELKPD